MTIYYTARALFDKSIDEGPGWDGYIAWTRMTHLTEVVSLDGMLNKPLIEPDYGNAVDWAHIVTQGQFITGLFTTLDYVLKKVKPIGRFNLLAVVIEPTEACNDSALDDFEFIGYDLLEKDFGISSLTNCDGFDEPYSPDDINRFGLLDEFEKAYSIKKRLLENNPEHPHADTNVMAVWRHKVIGR